MQVLHDQSKRSLWLHVFMYCLLCQVITFYRRLLSLFTKVGTYLHFVHATRLSFWISNIIFQSRRVKKEIPQTLNPNNRFQCQKIKSRLIGAILELKMRKLFINTIHSFKDQIIHYLFSLIPRQVPGTYKVEVKISTYQKIKCKFQRTQFYKIKPKIIILTINFIKINQ